MEEDNKIQIRNEIKNGRYWEEEEKKNVECIRGRRNHGNMCGRGA